VKQLPIEDGKIGHGAVGDKSMSSRFGPSAVLTPANLLTIGRLVAAPILVTMVAVWGPTWAAVVVAFCVCSTDGLDGWIARRHGATTSGAFLDPLADKAVVLGTFVVLAARSEIAWLPVGLIALREISMSLYRTVMSRKGVSIPARSSAKWKTVIQDLVLGLCLLPPMVKHYSVLEGAIWLATALTLATGLQYLYDGRRAAGGSVSGGTSSRDTGEGGHADLRRATG
jgi:CDP-diacylglycerol--glycerol-3-phosphate 3-phosphatidyltransferase